MGRKAQIVIKEDIEYLKRLVKKQSRLSNEKKVRCLIWIKENESGTRQELSDYLLVSKRTVERWITTYSRQGIEELIRIKPRQQRSKIITQDIHAGLSQRVNSIKNSFKGYWDAQRWVKSEYGAEVKYHNLRKYMIKHFGTKLMTPRKSHIKKDDRAVALFKNAT